MLNVNRKNDRIIGALNGKPFNVTWSQERYTELVELSSAMESAESKEVLDAITAKAEVATTKNINEEVAAVNGYLKYRSETGTYHLVINKGTNNEVISRDPIPHTLAECLVESYENAIDFMPLLIAWRRFISVKGRTEEDRRLFANYMTSMYVDREQQALLVEEGTDEKVAEELSTYNDIAITTYGLLATYKVVDIVKEIFTLTTDDDGNTVKKLVPAFKGTQDIDPVTGEVTKTEGKPKHLEEVTFKPAICQSGDKFFCGDVLGYKYMIGKEAVLPEDAKRNTSNTFGGGGLYAGGLGYIEGYSNDNNETLTCFIDPAEIISFQDDGRAFRTNRMFINGVVNMEGELSGMYFVSEYAKESDARMEEKFKEAIVAKTKAKIEADEEDAVQEGIISDITNGEQK